MSKQDKKVLLMYPPGPLYQRGEDRCKSNIEASSASSTRSCNDLGYAAATLCKAGYEPRIRDYQTAAYDQARSLSDICSYQPDLIMISVVDASIVDDLAFIQKIKDRFQDSPSVDGHTSSKDTIGKVPVIVLKGAMFFNAPDCLFEQFDFSAADYLIGGEVDQSIAHIANHAFGRLDSAKSIPGILYKDADGMFRKTFFTSSHVNLDDVPFPARDLMDLSLYARPDTGEPMATIQTSRGCYGTCSLCRTPKIAGVKVIFRKPENVFAEIEECYHVHGIKAFFFRADTFTSNEQWIHRLCDLIIASNLAGKISFAANSRVKPLQKATLQRMKDAGCFVIAFSYDSGSDETLLKIRKGAETTDNLRAANWARQVGLPVYGFFVVGYPWETKTLLAQTRKHVFKLNPDYLEIHIALPYWGTQLQVLHSQSGTLEDYVVNQPVFMDNFESSITGVRNITIDQLRNYRKYTLLAFYLRPKYLYTRLAPTIKNPRATLSYIRYGWKLISNLLRGQ
ncbi:MAG: radical SAM protein [Coriobacteriia bacterium]|nr:radical SAM protein [Coriobacteriia bacterium]